MLMLFPIAMTKGLALPKTNKNVYYKKKRQREIFAVTPFTLYNNSENNDVTLKDIFPTQNTIYSFKDWSNVKNSDPQISKEVQKFRH